MAVSTSPKIDLKQGYHHFAIEKGGRYIITF